MTVHTNKTGTVESVTTALPTAANGSAVSAGDLDFTAAGSNANLREMLFGRIRGTLKWATVTNIGAGTVIADVYFVPKLDGSNPPQIDTTAGTSFIPATYRVGELIAARIPTANTATIFDSRWFELHAEKVTVYLLNRSGQTWNASNDGVVDIRVESAQSN